MTRSSPGYNGPMRAYGFSARFIFFVLQAGAWGVALCQEPAPFATDPAPSGGDFEETEQLPRFQIEVIAFAYNAFDPTEEQFHREHKPMDLSTGPGTPVEPPRELPSQGIDPYQRPAPWPPAGRVPTEPAGPAFPDDTGFRGDATGNAIERSGAYGSGNEFDRGTIRGQVVEEPPSISEQILSTLLTLEEEPDPLNPLDPNGTSNALEPGVSPGAPLDPLAQGASTDPAPRDLIAVQERSGPLNPSQPPAARGEPAEEPLQFRFLTREELELTAESARLDRLDAYTVLAHGGWVQEGLPEDRARPFNVAMLGALNPMGTVQLHLSRFLHVTVALDYRARAARPVTAAPPFPTYSNVLEEVSLPPVYELRATRRTRSGELHYFDHPAFGLLVLVRPAPELPEESEDTEESLNPPLGPAA